MFRTNKDGYLEYVPDEKNESSKSIEKHYYHYIPYPVYVQPYPGYPRNTRPYPYNPTTTPIITGTNTTTRMI